ncbi:MAG TPA: DUF3300 domain-containing protein [Candidatus Acidoferrum sp.]|nr:DUF3300 domain-containing protein [Candidatus Acidoferrum sp.]
MERRNSLVQQSLALILAICMNLSLANGALGIPQAGSTSNWTPEQLDQLLAPIALYPDALLMQVLAASVDPQEVLDGGNWLLQNKTLQGDQLDSAAKAAGFGPAMMALFHFPQVVDMMCSEMDWTRQLGDAFNASQGAVLDSVQRLRLQAKQAGNLQTTPQQTVVTQQAGGQQVIVIQPTNPQVIYVPQYNPVQVYVPPAPAPQSSGVSTETAVVGALVAFGVGMAVGSMFSSNNYYYPHWGYGGGVYYRGGPWVSHHYVYRPVYGPHYHRATVYYRPANYPYAYNRPYPGNTHYNSGNYYNKYRGNTNNQNKSNNTINRNVSGNNVTINTGNQKNRTGNTSVGSGNAQTNQSWKGQSTYNGGSRINGNSPNNASRNPSTTYNRPSQTSTQVVKPDRGYSSGSPATPQTRSNSKPTTQPRTAGAFEGSGNNGRTERTSSQRGAASTQGRRGNK